jgi:hypothetical protein
LLAEQKAMLGPTLEAMPTRRVSGARAFAPNRRLAMIGDGAGPLCWRAPLPFGARHDALDGYRHSAAMTPSVICTGR